MSAFKIGDSPFRPTGGVSNSKKPEPKAEEKAAAPLKGAYDMVNVRANRLAAMPRMGAVGRQSAQHVRGGAVESLLKESAAELDDYFTGAYGFDGNPK